jgi:hypothetical protein
LSIKKAVAQPLAVKQDLCSQDMPTRCGQKSRSTGKQGKNVKISPKYVQGGSVSTP